MRFFTLFLFPFPYFVSIRRTLADIIMEKITEKQTEVETVMSEISGCPMPQLNPRVLEVYKGVREVRVILAFVQDACVSPVCIGAHVCIFACECHPKASSCRAHHCPCLLLRCFGSRPEGNGYCCVPSCSCILRKMVRSEC